ncbi:SMP-30/gluconolactonase/LRE family protein [Crossiella cryophila]|uniref:Sugar lactone lactonase YvrE n=1 Tax=Crossiella cryophila TaxID=43355 RepID=A0A7W7FPL5_9PSEU|nr:superoxide dismutase [Crossiella cryophila]MBB4673971.1 sugar lactone lactonase YvrE [Crossiella cryophila]
MRVRRLLAGTAVVVTALAGAPVAVAGTAPFPTEFALPNGFQPEGVAIGGASAYFGSRVDGSIYKVDLASGKGTVFSKGPGTPSLGLKTDWRGRLFVSGGTGGDARVVDTRTGKVLASYAFAEAGKSFINDVVLTPGAAYFTDSRNPALYRLPLGRDGALPAADKFTKIPLTGDFAQVGEGVNANGLVTTPAGDALLVVQSNTGKLFRVDPRTGVARTVDLGGALLTNGDGLLRDGRTLYVVQNRLNVVTEFKLAADGGSGKLTRSITDPRFDVPATVAQFGHRLYLPNARFTTPPTPTTPYNAVAVDIR